MISDLSHFKVDAEIADSYGDRVSPGAHAKVRLGKTQLDGHVSSVTPLSKNGVISFTIMLDDDDNQRLRSGLRTDVFVMCDIKDEVVRIANAPFFKGPGVYDLFVESSDGELEKRQVKLGDSNYEYVEVVSGLKKGERVVVSDMSNFAKSEPETEQIKPLENIDTMLKQFIYELKSELSGHMGDHHRHGTGHIPDHDGGDDAGGQDRPYSPESHRDRMLHWGSMSITHADWGDGTSNSPMSYWRPTRTSSNRLNRLKPRPHTRA